MEIKDSGSRTEFSTGAVRDIQEGKGRCDLLPLDVAAWAVAGRTADNYVRPDPVLFNLHLFQKSGDITFLYSAINAFTAFDGIADMLLEVSVHFSEGAKKYQEDNWRKGIPAKRYLDSSVRHYLKWLRSDEDEPHARAVCWNLMCCCWTCDNMPELNDYANE